MFKELILGCALLSATIAGASEPASASEPAAAGEAAAGGCGTLRVAFYEEGALYYKAADGGWTGIDKDVVEELGRRLGCTIVATTDSRVRVWAALSNGTIDLSTSALSNPEREKIGRFVPYLGGRDYVMLNRDIAGKVRSMDAFLADPQYKIAVIKTYKHGKIYDAWLDRLRAQGRVFEVPDFSSLLRLLKVGRVQAVLTTNTGWIYAVKHEQIGEIYRIMDWAPKETIIGCLILSRQRFDEAMAARFQQTMHAMREDGTLKRIYERHVPADIAATLVNF